jgi:hypothetical protein
MLQIGRRETSRDGDRTTEFTAFWMVLAETGESEPKRRITPISKVVIRNTLAAMDFALLRIDFHDLFRTEIDQRNSRNGTIPTFESIQSVSREKKNCCEFML